MTTVWRPARSQRPAAISEATSCRVRPAARSFASVGDAVVQRSDLGAATGSKLPRHTRLHDSTVPDRGQTGVSYIHSATCVMSTAQQGVRST